MDGTISANGGNGSGTGGGGGSGGSIWLAVGTLSGAGSITANGGSGADRLAAGAAAVSSNSLTVTSLPEMLPRMAAAGPIGVGREQFTPKPMDKTAKSLWTTAGIRNHTPLQSVIPPV